MLYMENKNQETCPYCGKVWEMKEVTKGEPIRYIHAYIENINDNKIHTINECVDKPSYDIAYQ